MGFLKSHFSWFSFGTDCSLPKRMLLLNYSLSLFRCRFFLLHPVFTELNRSYVWLSIFSRQNSATSKTTRAQKFFGNVCAKKYGLVVKMLLYTELLNSLAHSLARSLASRHHQFAAFAHGLPLKLLFVSAQNARVSVRFFVTSTFSVALLHVFCFLLAHSIVFFSMWERNFYGKILALWWSAKIMIARLKFGSFTIAAE